MPNRAKGAEMFDPAEYAKRDMIEGIFGAEEAKNHQLHCRSIKEGNSAGLAGFAASGGAQPPSLFQRTGHTHTAIPEQKD